MKALQNLYTENNKNNRIKLKNTQVNGRPYHAHCLKNQYCKGHNFIHAVLWILWNPDEHLSTFVYTEINKIIYEKC